MRTGREVFHQEPDMNVMTDIEPPIYLARGGAYVVTPWRADLAATIPHAKELTWQGERKLLIPNRIEEAKVARNLGVQMPPPILTNYDWLKSKPWDIQRTTAALLVESPRCYVLNSMGTGKSRSVLFAADWLMRHLPRVKRMLICAPLSTLTPVWEREAFQLMLGRQLRVLHGSREERLRLLAEDAEIYVINHHGVKIIQSALIQKAFDIVVVDELAVFRRRTTELWKAVNGVINPAIGPRPKWVWGLTGSPTPNAPTDAWAQVKLLTPNNTTRTFMAFREQVMTKVSVFRWVPRQGANELVQSIMTPSVRFTRDDVMELPETMYVDRKVTLDPLALKAYRLLEKKARMLTEKGAIDAVNEGILQSKLLQVACGYIYTNSKGVYELPAKGRLDALDEVVDETDRKLLVMVPYLHALNGVVAHLSKHHQVACVHGGTSRLARDRIFSDFQTKASPRIIIAHPQTLAHGLTLTEANVIVWYAPTQSLEIYEQANARITRPGQTSKTLIVHLTGTAVESATYARLKSKAKMQGCLLNLFAEQKITF
jgi:SNF2 family DNA or RNA helicase